MKKHNKIKNYHSLRSFGRADSARPFCGRYVYQHSMDLELKQSLEKALSLFENRAFDEWVHEISESLRKLESRDFSFIEPLWLKCAPTCEIDDLYLIDVSEKEQENATKLNDELAKVANSLFAALDKKRNEKT